MRRPDYIRKRKRTNRNIRDELDFTTIKALISNIDAEVETDILLMEEGAIPNYLFVYPWMRSFEIPSVLDRHLSDTQHIRFVLLLPYGSDPLAYIKEQGLEQRFDNILHFRKSFVVHFFDLEKQEVVSHEYKYNLGAIEIINAYVHSDTLLAKAKEAIKNTGAAGSTTEPTVIADEPIAVDNAQKGELIIQDTRSENVEEDATRYKTPHGEYSFNADTGDIIIHADNPTDAFRVINDVKKGIQENPKTHQEIFKARFPIQFNDTEIDQDNVFIFDDANDRDREEYPIVYVLDRTPEREAAVEDEEFDSLVDQAIDDYLYNTQPSTTEQAAEKKKKAPKSVIDEIVAWLRENVDEGAELAVSLIPGLSDIYDGVSAILGKSPITGEKLDPIDRLLSLSGALLPLIPGKWLRYGRKAVKYFIGENKAIRMVNAAMEDAIAALEALWDKFAPRKAKRQIKKLDEQEATTGGGAIPDQKRDDWLKHHEDTHVGRQAHGHTKQRHVGTGNQALDDEQIAVGRFERVIRDGEFLPSASSYFKNLDLAQKEISNAIRSQKDNVGAWLRDSGNNSATFTIASKDIGRTLTRRNYRNAIANDLDPKGFIEDCHNIVVVVKKNPNGKGFHILTSYPTSKPPKDFVKFNQ